MTDSSRAGANITVLLAILALSAGTMLWLFWHYPVITAVATVAILATLGVSARLARSTDTDMTELKRPEQSF
jgi:hypothetical protein